MAYLQILLHYGHTHEHACRRPVITGCRHAGGLAIDSWAGEGTADPPDAAGWLVSLFALAV